MLVNAQLLAEGWNSPRATVCMHLAPTASKRIYQQRVGRVTRRHPGKEAGIVVDFVHPATKHDDPVVTLHSLLDRDVYRGGAIVVGPVRRGRGRRLRVERRVVPVTADENRRIEVFERELWRIAVEHLDYGEQVQWAALAGARVAPAGWRRARAMLHFDEGGELKRAFLLTAVERNKNPQLRLRALQEIAASRDAEAFDRAIEMIGGWPREEKREGVKVVLQSLAEKKIGRRDQANNWIWACAEMTREVHEEYAVQRWPETKRLLGLLVNSSGGAHARNARRLVHAARQQDRRLAAALLAAALPHTAEAGEVINGARTRMSRKPAALARELLRNFPKGGKGRRGQRRRKKGKGGEGSQVEAQEVGAATFDETARARPRRSRSAGARARRLTARRPLARGQARGPGRRRARAGRGRARHGRGEPRAAARGPAGAAEESTPPRRRATSRSPLAVAQPVAAPRPARRREADGPGAERRERRRRRRRSRSGRAPAPASPRDEAEPTTPRRRRSRRALAAARAKAAEADAATTAAAEADADAARRRRARRRRRPRSTRGQAEATRAPRHVAPPTSRSAADPRPRAPRRTPMPSGRSRRPRPARAGARSPRPRRGQRRADAARARLRAGPRRGPRGQAAPATKPPEPSAAQVDLAG